MTSAELSVIKIINQLRLFIGHCCGAVLDARDCASVRWRQRSFPVLELHVLQCNDSNNFIKW